MSVQVSVTVPAKDFVLGQLLREHSISGLRLDSLVSFEESLTPYLRMAEADIETVRRGLRSDPDIDTFEVLDTGNEGVLVRVKWSSSADEFVEGLTESQAVITEAASGGFSWSLELRFPDHDRLSEFHAWCLDRGIDLLVEEVYRTNGVRDDEDALTDVQQETLLTAFELGYFEVPRNVTLTELAEELDISDSAVSQRLRRGMATLVARHGTTSESEP